MQNSTTFRKNLSKLAAKGCSALADLRHAEPGEVSRGERVAVDLCEVDVVYIYGVGDGESYRQLQEWLHNNPQRYLVYLEHDLRALRSAMEGEELVSLLEDGQVKLHLIHREEKESLLLSWCTTYFSGMRAAFAALPSYSSRYPERITRLEQSIGCQSYDTAVILQELFANCAGFFSNFYPNLFRLPENYHGNRLFGKFEGVPAIICGAGPSLEMNIDLLAKLRDRALILAPGSAMNALGEFGVMPHFGCASDPNIDQVDRFERNPLLQVPLFYGNRWHRSILPFWHSPLLFLHGLGLHELEQSVERELGLVGGEPFEPGHSATHLCLNIARALGCRPIILVGQDLAYSEGKSYADSVGAPISAETNHYYERPVVARSVWGQEVKTAWKWIVEERWMAKWAQRHPECRLVNATEGGLGIEGIAHMTLREARALLGKSYPLDARVDAEVQSSKIRGVTREQIAQVVRPFAESLDRSLPIVANLVEELARMEERGGTRLRSGRAALLESDFYDEPAYRLVFEGILTLCSATLCRQVEQWRRLPSEQERLERLQLDRRKYAFVREGIEVHRKLLKGVIGC